MDKDISADIKTIKDPWQRLLIRILFILLFGAGSIIAFLYRGSSDTRRQDLTDCKTEVGYWRRRSDSFEISAYQKDADQRMRLQEKEKIFDSIIRLGKSLNIVK